MCAYTQIIIWAVELLIWNAMRYKQSHKNKSSQYLKVIPRKKEKQTSSGPRRALPKSGGEGQIQYDVWIIFIELII